jgi:hypothetical protein
VRLELTRTSRLRFPGEAPPYTQWVGHARHKYARVGIIFRGDSGQNSPDGSYRWRTLNLYTATLTGTSLFSLPYAEYFRRDAKVDHKRISERRIA